MFDAMSHNEAIYNSEERYRSMNGGEPDEDEDEEEEEEEEEEEDEE